MTMKYEQWWKKILSEINNDKDLSKDNVIEKIKKKLKVADEDEYRKWEEADFGVNQMFEIEYNKACVVRGFFGLPSIRHEVEIHQRTLFILAAITGNVKIVETLIEKGVDINATDEDGLTPLHWAALQFDEEVIKTLVNKGAGINAVNNDGQTPLYLAATGFLNHHILSVLIKNGADINLVDKDGRTPLHAAAPGYFNTMVIDVLIESGSDPLLMDNFGKTPIDLNTSGYIIEFLEKKAIKKGIFSGSSTALLGTVVAGTLFTIGVFEVGLMPIIVAVIAIATAALAVGGITYMISKPSTKVDKVEHKESLFAEQQLIF